MKNPINLRKVKFFTKGLKMGKVQLVPIRKVGMTGSGKEYDCHSNVSKLVSVYGGKRVVGYSLEFNKEYNEFLFSPHSVWETPEGKLVDVTLNWKQDDEVMFLPYADIDADNGYYFSNFDFYVSADTTKPIEMTKQCQTVKQFSRKDIKRGKLRSLSIWKHNKKSYFEIHPEKLDVDYVSFSKPSTSTGKIFEMREVT